MSNVQNRDVAIDLVKVVATLMVMNSHMAICYGTHSAFATGGGIGDALFFFVSGFTLFLSGKSDVSFFYWYKRRIGRIYPTVLAMGVVAVFFFGTSDSFSDVITAKRYWFLQAILVNYILIYPVIKFKWKFKYCIPVASIVVIAAFFTLYDNTKAFYGTNDFFRWSVYYVVMLVGGLLCSYRAKIEWHWYTLPALLVCIAAWYCSLYLWGTGNFQLLSVVPLLGICYYTYSLGKSQHVNKLFSRVITGNVLYIVGNLCLESYLIQKFIFTDALNGLFPLNIPVIMIAVLIAAYLLHILSGIISQIFDSKPFNWEALLLYKK